MSRWDDLYKEVTRIEQAERERAARELEATASRRSLEQWSDRVTTEVMDRFRDAALERAREFGKRTGRNVTVHYPAREPIDCGPEGPWMTFMTLQTEGSELQVYSYRIVDELPSVYFLPMPPRGDDAPPSLTRRRHRLISVPGAFATRNPDDSYQLMQPSSPDEGPARPIGVDELVFAAFDLLITGLRKD
jgi:hypothetical protein